MAEPKKSSEETVQEMQKVFIDTEISAIGPWWSTEITENLIDLKLIDCKISLVNLLAMLQQTPNLRSLYLYCGSTLVYNAAVDKFFDLRLEKMDYLKLDELKQRKVMEVLLRTFPRLKDFEMTSKNDKCYDRFFEVMNDPQGCASLEGLSLKFATPQIVHVMLSHLAQVKHQFQRVFLVLPCDDGNLQRYNDQLIAFSKNQPLLKSLTLWVDKIPLQISSDDQHSDASKCLSEVFGNLLHLERLFIYNISDDADLSGLECLTELKDFRFDGHTIHQPFSFNGIKHPNLEKLHLGNVAPAPGELQEYIGHAPNLREITLQNCALDSLAELFDAVHPERLRHLDLDYVKVSNDATLLGYLDELRSLKLTYCGMTKEFLLALLGRCPRLEELSLIVMEHVCDDVVLELCQKLPGLRKLTIRYCSITATASEHLRKHGMHVTQDTNGSNLLVDASRH